jgi:hypothetical protein
MVTICEDGAHLVPAKQVAIESAADLLFMLVVDRELESGNGTLPRLCSCGREYHYHCLRPCMA